MWFFPGLERPASPVGWIWCGDVAENMGLEEALYASKSSLSPRKPSRAKRLSSRAATVISLSPLIALMILENWSLESAMVGVSD